MERNERIESRRNQERDLKSIETKIIAKKTRVKNENES